MKGIVRKSYPIFSQKPKLLRLGIEFVASICEVIGCNWEIGEVKLIPPPL